MPADRVEHVADGRAHRGGVGAPDAHPADIGLVSDVGRVDLDHDRVAEPLRRAHRRLRVVCRDRVCQRDAELAEDALGLRVGEHATSLRARGRPRRARLGACRDGPIKKVPVFARVAQGLHRGLGRLQKRHAGVDEGLDDLGVEVAAGERAEGDHQAVGGLLEPLAHRAAELARRRRAAGLRDVDAQIHRQDIEGVLTQQHVEELGEDPRDLVHRAGAVERIAGIGEVRHEDA